MCFYVQGCPVRRADIGQPVLTAASEAVHSLLSPSTGLSAARTATPAQGLFYHAPSEKESSLANGQPGSGRGVPGGWP